MLPTYDATNLRGDENRLTTSDYRFYSRFMICLGLLVIAAGVVVLSHNWRFLKILRGGPETVTPARLRKAGSPDALPTPWISLDSSKVYDTGVRAHVGWQGLEVRYVLVPVEDRYLLTEVPWNYQAGTRLTGYLEEWEPGRNGANILNEVKTRGYGEGLLPYQLGAAGNQGVNFAVWLATGPLIVVGGLVCIGTGRAYRSRQPVPWDPVVG
jgi:hypothetical protein